MHEHGIPEVGADVLDRLSLGLVDGHGKGKPDGELLSLQVKPDHIIWELELYPGDEDVLAMVATSQQSTCKMCQRMKRMDLWELRSLA